MALLDREDIGRGRTQVDPIGTGETNSAVQYAAVNDIEALTLPVFTVVDEGLISEEMCQEGSSANAQRVFGTDNKLSAYRFAQFNVRKQEAISCVWLRRINPWALMAILILESTMHRA